MGGDRRSAPTFADAYDAHVWDVYGFFAYRLARRQDAEDLTQATFERALRAWARYDPDRAQPSTWLLAIARNVLIDHWRADRSDRHDVLDPDSDIGGSTAGPESRLGLEPNVERALGELSAREREVVALRFGADLTGPEIAELTETSLASVQQALSRALRRLRGELEEPGEEAEAPADHPA
jgi:RNA polymerase sigma-70 factor (ECF subfamily)